MSRRRGVPGSGRLSRLLFCFVASLIGGSIHCSALAQQKHKRYKALRLRSNNPIDWEQDRVSLGGHTHTRTYVVGSDESGTGCLAGPVVAVSCCIRTLKSYTPLSEVQDGKQLDLSACQKLYDHVLAHPDVYAWSHTVRTNTQIDEAANVQSCILDALDESIDRVRATLRSSDDSVDDTTTIYSVVDGHRAPRGSSPFKHADATIYTVALASCLARHIHATHMQALHTQYPHYGFDQHGGYATRAHVEALMQHGSSPVHRNSCQPCRDNNRRNVLLASGLASVMGVATATTLYTKQPAYATYIDSSTGIALPEAGEIASSVPKSWAGIDNPLDDLAKPFSRLDSSSDDIFYQDPRFVEHVDTQAVGILSKYVGQVIGTEESSAILDLCASWTSHIPKTNLSPKRRVAGLGMNAKELESNDQLTDWKVQDVNLQPVLPYADNSFDVVLCQLSIDYLTQPLKVCAEIYRVLRPGGSVHILFSNRLFLSKAVAVWTGQDDVDHAFLVASYFRFSAVPWAHIEAQDLSERNQKRRVMGDPVYVVKATKGS